MHYLLQSGVPLAPKKGQKFTFPGLNYVLKAGPQAVPHKNQGPGMAIDGGEVKRGLGNLKTGPRECWALDGEQGGVKKKMIPRPACPGVNTSLVSWPYV